MFWSLLTGAVPLPDPLDKEGRIPPRWFWDGWQTIPTHSLSLWILQQPWCITVLTDLLMVTTAYFSSEHSLEESGQKDR